MRPRAELALALGLVLLLGIGAAALGSRRARVADTDPRRSTFLSGPSGARALADALVLLGVEVVRHRRTIEPLTSGAAGDGRVVLLLGPTRALDSREGALLASAPVDLVLAGPGAEAAMICLGYRVQRRRPAVGVVTPAPPGERAFPDAGAVLARHLAGSVTDSAALGDGRIVTCTVPAPARVDTLLRTGGHTPVALSLTYDSGRRVVLVADDRLFSNRALRETAAGPFALGLVVPRYRQAVIDELHHGHRASGSLAGETLRWSLRSPWGWAAWQLAVVGLAGMFAAGVRFGPVREVIDRRRRSPLEHVRALATALAAARGHDVAVRLMLQGLRRRLSRTGRPARGDLEAWLAGLAPSLRTSRGRTAHAELTDLTRRRTSADEVLVAAHAVETLWEELKPS